MDIGWTLGASYQEKVLLKKGRKRERDMLMLLLLLLLLSFSSRPTQLHWMGGKGEKRREEQRERDTAHVAALLVGEDEAP